LRSNLRPIDTLSGVEPPTDKTKVATKHFTNSDKIRFRNGLPEKIGGWQSIEFDYDETVDGYARSLFTSFINGKYYTVIGTNTKLYSLIGSALDNITPAVTTPTAAANSLSTHYDTLSNNPISATNGSMFVTIADTEAALFVPGDIYVIAGATAFAGLGIGDLNGDFIVREVGINLITVYVGVAANATTTGGGNAVVRSSGLITVDSTAHGQLDGDRVKIESAGNTGGVLAADINMEFIIRNVTTDTFDVMTEGTATSSVTAAGGAGTEYYIEIPDGLINETNAQGYGAGMYGLGLYGTALVSNTSRSYPRIWFMDRYADTIIMTPGNQTGVYQWQGTVEAAPVLIPNAPTAINYVFVSDNIMVTFGAGGIENRVFASDQNDIEEWTSSSVNQVFDDDIEGIGRLTSHCPVEDYNLIFTEFETYKMRYIGLPFVWEITPVDETIGLIAPMARCSVKGMAFWMGQENFYFYRGGTVEIIPSNASSQSTCLQYVFQNINWGQKSKCFGWYNKQYNEVWFHYPDANSNEPNRLVRVNLLDFTWSIDTMDRTCAEYPNVKLVNPRLMNVGTLYKHEFGTDADGEPMAFTLTSNRKWYGTDTANQIFLVPDSTQAGTININQSGYLYPQSTTAMYSNNYDVTQSTEHIAVTNNGRYYEYTWSGDELGQNWTMGTWFEEPQKGPRE
jgi:hypothetical protein